MCWAKQSSLAPKDGSIGNIGLPHEEFLLRDWTFLNIDGAIQVTSRRAAAGGMVRDGTGDWVIGYNRFLGNCLIFYIELWGILDDLKLIQCRGYSNVVIHFDSLEVVKAIHDNVSNISNSALIRKIHRILSQESQ
ncbi:hypothetical protein J1N35_010541 [Gossypium stocksii]|uniref:RNase H type-1 domain-containing protein n=1 Tax=Gossypium stocksii TaxID=47602 RepID=A0A9D3W2J9_9ROSI|nr:hypothetical protein J1N35_010541 [Gossypium stocksii]